MIYNQWRRKQGDIFSAEIHTNPILHMLMYPDVPPTSPAILYRYKLYIG